MGLGWVLAALGQPSDVFANPILGVVLPRLFRQAQGVQITRYPHGQMTGRISFHSPLVQKHGLQKFEGFQRPHGAEPEAAPFDSQKQVFSESVADSPWPRVTVYLKVKASPRQAAEIYSNYADHSRFLPSCIESEVVEALEDGSTKVRYVMDLPWGLGRREYFMINQITVAESSGAYSVQSERIQIPGQDGSQIVGSVQFIPAGPEGSEHEETLIIQTGLTVPTPSAWFNWSRPIFVNRVKQIEEAKAEALAARIEAELVTARRSVRQ